MPDRKPAGNLALEILRVSDPVKADFNRLQAHMTRVKGRQVTQSEVVEELIKVYRHVDGEVA